MIHVDPFPWRQNENTVNSFGNLVKVYVKEKGGTFGFYFGPKIVGISTFNGRRFSNAIETTKWDKLLAVLVSEREQRNIRVTNEFT